MSGGFGNSFGGNAFGGARLQNYSDGTTDSLTLIENVDIVINYNVSLADLLTESDAIEFDATFYATAQSPRKVQLTFSAEMLQNPEYTDAASYSLEDLNGNAVAISSVQAVGTTPNHRVALLLGADLVPGGYYVATILSGLVETAEGYPVEPKTRIFQWKKTLPTGLVLKISDFTGEVSSGLLGQPLGQVFFSPALEHSAANSSIQVDSLSVCTRAYDVYTPPSPPDPTPFYLYGGAVQSTLGTAVLWTTFDRLLGAQIELSDTRAETLGGYTDGPATYTLEEPFDHTLVSYLNNPYWTIFDGIGTPFIVTNNLAPIPPGPTVGPIVL